jgi:hypothetical protein
LNLHAATAESQSTNEGHASAQYAECNKWATAGVYLFFIFLGLSMMLMQVLIGLTKLYLTGAMVRLNAECNILNGH